MPAILPSRITELSPHDCWNLLKNAQHGVGRIAFVDVDAGADSAPQLLPVNYVLNGPEVIMRTGGSLINRAADQSCQATFEIDSITTSASTSRDVGWSVVVHGPMGRVTDAMARRYLELSGLAPSAGGYKPNFVRLQVESISGRRIWATALDTPSHQSTDPSTTSEESHDA